MFRLVATVLIVSLVPFTACTWEDTSYSNPDEYQIPLGAVRLAISVPTDYDSYDHCIALTFTDTPTTVVRNVSTTADPVADSEAYIYSLAVVLPTGDYEDIDGVIYRNPDTCPASGVPVGGYGGYEVAWTATGIALTTSLNVSTANRTYILGEDLEFGWQ